MFLAVPGAAPQGFGDFLAPYDPETYEGYYEPLRRRQYARFFDRVRPLVPAGRLLDIGCSFGWLLEEAERRGYEAYGIEPSPETLRRVPGHLRVRQAQIEDLVTLPWGEFDLVVLWHVLEHLVDPVTALNRAAAKARPEGLVVVNVPSGAGILFRLASAAYRLSGRRAVMPLEELHLVGNPSPHLHYFTPRSLVSAATEAGLRVVDHYADAAFDPRQVGMRIGWRTGKGIRATALRILVSVAQAAVAPLGWLDNIVVLLERPSTVGRFRP